MQIDRLDHVALWVAERDRIAEALTGATAMHVIERTDAFTLVGTDARRGKLTLFAAEAPRDPGPLRHVGLRVSAQGAARARLDGARDLPDGLAVRLVEAPTDVEYDLDHVALASRDPHATAARYLELGFRRAEPGAGGEPRVEAGGAFLEFHEGDPSDSQRPLLNHVAVLVRSADDVLAEARERGLDVADVVDAANTKAVFVWGPDRVKIEYVEHKPGFSLV